MPSFIGWVPTPPEHIDGFFELVQLTSSDVVYDLGSGDGRILFAALEKGAAKAVGVDLDAELVKTAAETARSKGLQDKVTFLQADVMDVNLADASVVFCYLISQASAALRPKFESELKQGTRVVMESFPVPGWKPVQTIYKDYKQFYLYVMPPEVTGESPPDYTYMDYF
jgi:ubiquinone/menaquinone biosynthesis C-methylase UbiE